VTDISPQSSPVERFQRLKRRRPPTRWGGPGSSGRPPPAPTRIRW